MPSDFEVGDTGTVQRIYRRNELTRVTGLNSQYLYELINSGRFPAPIKLGERASGWLESEILAWQRARIAERRGAR